MSGIADAETFKRAMRRWLQLDVHLNQHAEAMRAVRDERTALQSHLLRYIEATRMQEQTFDAEANGLISYKTTTTYPSYTKKFLGDKLLTFFEGDAGKRDACLQFLQEQRVPSTQATLRRTPAKAEKEH